MTSPPIRVRRPMGQDGERFGPDGQLDRMMFGSPGDLETALPGDLHQLERAACCMSWPGSERSMLTAIENFIQAPSFGRCRPAR